MTGLHTNSAYFLTDFLKCIPFFLVKGAIQVKLNGLDLPNYIPHQEEEGVLGRGAEILSIYCYLLVRRDVQQQTNRITAETSVEQLFLNSP